MYPTVYLSSNYDESKSYHDNLLHIMESAGMEVINLPEDIAGLGGELKASLKRSNCSVHILSRDAGKASIENPTVSLARIQLDEARKRLSEDPDFKLFIWYPPEVVAAAKEPAQEQCGLANPAC
jgi:hypothetical protein